MFKTKNSIGLDISDNSIEVVELERKDSAIVIKNLGRTILNENIVVNGRIRSKEKLKVALDKVFNDAKPEAITGKKIIFGLPSSQVSTKVLEIGGHGLIEKNEFVKNLVLKNFSFDQEDIVYTYKLLNKYKRGDKQEILVAASSKKVITEWQLFFNSLDFQVDYFDIEELALFRGLFNERIKKPVCLVDIGAMTTNISFFNSTGLRYSYTADFAGKFITKKIAAKLKLKVAEAESLKVKNGLTGDTIISSIIGEALIGVIEEVNAALFYFNERSKEKVDEIILLGGTSKLRGLTKYLSDKINVKLTLASPVLRDVKASLLYISASGLALKDIDDIWQKTDIVLPLVELPKVEIKAPQVIKDIEPVKKQEIKKEVRKVNFKIFLAFLILYSLLFYTFTYWNKFNQEKVIRQIIEQKIISPKVKIKEEIPIIEEGVVIQYVEVLDTTTGWLNVRMGPGTSYQIIDKVDIGERFEFLEEETGWFKVKLNEETEGWVSSQYAGLVIN